VATSAGPTSKGSWRFVNRLSTPDIAWEAIVILHAPNGFSSDQPAVRQLHVQPAFGLALISAMAVSTAAFVFVSFGALVWHLLH
jgi:hypothetical protein